ncbi:MAG: peptidase M28 [Deltaproteobacteria bacterium GWA2_57_13]|nr:MAG: peptidase M28 [Deltaproteobacteria bacterium GWA2_57_13]
MLRDCSDHQITRETESLIRELYPICRSITGDGVRQTLRILQGQIPLTIQEVASGTRVFDWTVPKEWNIRGAFIKNGRGDKIVDFADCNLHVVGYSVPFKGRLSLEELKKHLFALPEHPDWIPYRTTYYKESWGFCLSHRQLTEMTDGVYEVYIDSSLHDGQLTYGEYYIAGERSDEVLLSCHICHPSLCNDNLSGIALMVSLAKHLTQRKRRYSYRFLFIPGTIGSIAWLALNEAHVASIKHGFVVAGVGDKGGFTYKKSRRRDAEIDRVFSYVLRNSADNSKIIDFHPYGYDERQFCSPGFNLSVGCVMRTPFGEYPEYHTSADNLDFISFEALSDSFEKCVSALNILDNNGVYSNQNPKCEPQLGKRGVYGSIGGETDRRTDEMAILWVLNMSDGTNSLLDIADRSGLNFAIIVKAAQALLDHGLLKESPE